MRLTDNSNKIIRWTKISPDEVYERLKQYEDEEARGERFSKDQVKKLIKKAIEMFGQEIQRDLTFPLKIMKVFIQALKDCEPSDSITFEKIDQVYQRFVAKQGQGVDNDKV